MMLQPGVICPAVCFYDAGGYTLTTIAYYVYMSNALRRAMRRYRI